MAKSTPEKVLQFWYVLEQLMPFDLTAAIKNEKHEAAVKIHDDVGKRSNSATFPWLDPTLLERDFKLERLNECKEPIEYKYRIYLGVFPIESVLDFIQSLPKPASSEFEQFAFQSPKKTCYASFSIDKNGIIVDSSLNCSTMPWALKRVAEMLATGKKIDLSKWKEDFEKYLLSVKQEFSSIVKANSEADTKTTVAELEKLWELISCGLWQPKELSYLAHYVVMRSSRREDSQNNDILNSFYLSELAQAANAIAANKASQPLQRYLTTAAPQQTLVEEPQFLQHYLSPDRIPSGRWLDKPERNLSLMQQLAVNLAIEKLQQGGIFSINGPPGTGKTTLLRDLTADILVKQAEELVTYNHPADAFTQIDGVYRLDTRTAGFEIVVASSNNAAVENVSGELPSMGAIASEYRGRAAYFKEVSESVKNAASSEDKPESVPLDNRSAGNCLDSNWGLIAAVLGNKSNCGKFINGFWFDNIGSIRLLLKQEIDICQWSSARQKFKQKQQVVERLILERQYYWQQVRNRVSFASRYSEAKANFSKCKLDKQRQEDYCARLLSSEKQLAQKYEDDWSQLNSLEAQKFSLYDRWFRKSDCTEHQQRINSAKKDLQQRKASLGEIKEERKQAEKALRKKQQSLELVEDELNRLEVEKLRLQLLDRAQVQLGSAFGDERWWGRESKLLQLSAPWIDEELNRARSELFIAALELREQFIYQAAAPISKNLNKWVDLVKGQQGDLKDESILHLWQTFFLVVPVVSTTLASTGRLFSRLPAASLGWLLIDEAGQAIPQAAVGALQRVRRAVLVGDPSQIEPVFTLDSGLVKGLQNFFQVEDWWNPTKASVQTLGDRANSYGTQIDTGGELKWLGCPLWVHRRCISPMFEIANEIAYSNRMVSATALPDAEGKEFPLGESRWIDVSGACEGSHWVPEQGTEVVNLLAQAVEVLNTLPNLYVISPFREVAWNLGELLKSNQMQWARGKDGVDAWVKKSVGTVHTFQGKEADAVILILGADEKSRGAAMWASSKPNLLNVAATRAKYRFYIVGSNKLWSKLSFFDRASCLLRVETRVPKERPMLRHRAKDAKIPRPQLKHKDLL